MTHIRIIPETRDRIVWQLNLRLLEVRKALVAEKKDSLQHNALSEMEKELEILVAILEDSIADA